MERNKIICKIGYIFLKNIYLFICLCQVLDVESLVGASVQFSCSVVSDSLRPHKLQHTRPPCPSPTPGVHSDSCPSSQWCHQAISSSVIPFSSCPSPSQHQSLFQWVNSSHGWPKYWSFSFGIMPSKEIPGLISFRMDWLDPLAVQGMTLNYFKKQNSYSVYDRYH